MSFVVLAGGVAFNSFLRVFPCLILGNGDVLHNGCFFNLLLQTLSADPFVWHTPAANSSHLLLSMIHGCGLDLFGNCPIGLLLLTVSVDFLFPDHFHHLSLGLSVFWVEDS